MSCAAEAGRTSGGDALGDHQPHQGSSISRGPPAGQWSYQYFLGRRVGLMARNCATSLCAGGKTAHWQASAPLNPQRWSRPGARLDLMHHRVFAALSAHRGRCWPMARRWAAVSFGVPMMPLCVGQARQQRNNQISHLPRSAASCRLPRFSGAADGSNSPRAARQGGCQTAGSGGSSPAVCCQEARRGRPVQEGRSSGPPQNIAGRGRDGVNGDQPAAGGRAHQLEIALFASTVPADRAVTACTVLEIDEGTVSVVPTRTPSFGFSPDRAVIAARAAPTSNARFSHRRTPQQTGEPRMTAAPTSPLPALACRGRGLPFAATWQPGVQRAGHVDTDCRSLSFPVRASTASARNYAAYSREMGSTRRAPPFFPEAHRRYPERGRHRRRPPLPTLTKNYHHEVGGRRRAAPRRAQREHRAGIEPGALAMPSVWIDDAARPAARQWATREETPGDRSRADRSGSPSGPIHPRPRAWLRRQRSAQGQRGQPGQERAAF